MDNYSQVIFPPYSRELVELNRLKRTERFVTAKQRRESLKEVGKLTNRLSGTELMVLVRWLEWVTGGSGGL